MAFFFNNFFRFARWRFFFIISLGSLGGVFFNNFFGFARWQFFLIISLNSPGGDFFYNFFRFARWRFFSNFNNFLGDDLSFLFSNRFIFKWAFDETNKYQKTDQCY